MECSNPTIKNINGHNIVIPCGTCIGCLNTKRANWSLRGEYEFKNAKQCVFLTLTYSDENLPMNLYDFTKKQCYQQLANNKVCDLRAKSYDRFILNKEHARDFIKDIKKYWKDVVEIRYIINGEYGHSHRPHYHCILYLSKKLKRSAIERAVKDCWAWCDWRIMDKNNPLKMIQIVETKEDNLAVSNYVAKHSVKSSHGTIIQEKRAPLFRTSSNKGGGIGIQMMLKDPKIHKALYDENAPQYIERFVSGKVYKVGIPREVKRAEFGDICKTDDELDEISKNSLELLNNKVGRFEFMNSGTNLDSNVINEYSDTEANAFNRYKQALRDKQNRQHRNYLIQQDKKRHN